LKPGTSLSINWKSQDLNLKIVYYRPPLSGKTTDLEYIHSRVDPRLRGELVSLKTKEDRTIHLDFMEMGQIKGFKPKFNLHTMPSQGIYVASRKLVLQGVDGVIYVADSQAGKLRANIETM